MQFNTSETMFLIIKYKSNISNKTSSLCINCVNIKTHKKIYIYEFDRDLSVISSELIDEPYIADLEVIEKSVCISFNSDTANGSVEYTNLNCIGSCAYLPVFYVSESRSIFGIIVSIGSKLYLCPSSMSVLKMLVLVLLSILGIVLSKNINVYFINGAPLYKPNNFNFEQISRIVSEKFYKKPNLARALRASLKMMKKITCHGY